MKRSFPTKLIFGLMLAALGVVLVEFAAWFTFAAYVLGSLFDMVHLKDLNWASATEIAGLGTAGVLLIYCGLKLLAAWSTGVLNSVAHHRSNSG